MITSLVQTNSSCWPAHDMKCNESCNYVQLFMSRCQTVSQILRSVPELLFNVDYYDENAGWKAISYLRWQVNAVRLYLTLGRHEKITNNTCKNFSIHFKLFTPSSSFTAQKTNFLDRNLHSRTQFQIFLYSDTSKTKYGWFSLDQ